MEHGRRLYEMEVQKWMGVASISIVGISVVLALVGSALRNLAEAACRSGFLDEDGTACSFLAAYV
ncbi:hypothetical protein ACHAWF_003591 [Thalassiosira exigua]